jgi:hypothetical protein
MEHSNSYLSSPSSTIASLTPMINSQNPNQSNGLVTTSSSIHNNNNNVYAYESNSENCMGTTKLDINQLLHQLMSITDQSLKEAEKRYALAATNDDPTPPPSLSLPSCPSDAMPLLAILTSSFLFFVYYPNPNRKEELEHHRFKPALYQVLCEIKEKTCKQPLDVLDNIVRSR